MKKLLFGLMATVLLSGVSFAQSFEESVAIFPTGRIFKAGNTESSARTLILKSFGSYKPLPAYIIKDIIFTDDGKNNDVKAGDGIYTSKELFANLPKGTPKQEAVAVAESFKYNKEMDAFAVANRIKIVIKCNIRHTTSGTTVFGSNCATTPGGCVEFYNCTFEMGWY